MKLGAHGVGEIVSSDKVSSKGRHEKQKESTSRDCDAIVFLDDDLLKISEKSKVANVSSSSYRERQEECCCQN